MAKDQELETTTPAAVPALAHTPALEIGAEDVALQRLYLGQYMSEQVQEGRVVPGALFTALGKEDTEPNVLWEPGDDGGVVFHVLGMRRGKSITVDGELSTYAYDDPDAPPEAWVTYNYVICIPDADEEFPFKWLLTRTGKPAAQQINLILRKTAAQGPAYTQAFEVTTAARSNPKGKFFVPRVRNVEPTNGGVAASEKLVAMIPENTVDAAAPSSEPAI